MIVQRITVRPSQIQAGENQDTFVVSKCDLEILLPHVVEQRTG